MAKKSVFLFPDQKNSWNWVFRFTYFCHWDILYMSLFIKIYNFRGLSIAWGKKLKKLYGLTLNSNEQVRELISEFHMQSKMSYIKIDHHYEQSMLHWGSMSNISVFRVVSFSCPQRFRSGNLTEFGSFTYLGIIYPD